MTIQFSKDSKNVRVVLFTINGIVKAFISDLASDLYLIITSIVLVMCYAVVMLGSCSPVHLRCCVGFFGLLVVGISYVLGYSISGTAGSQTAAIHGLMPFLLIGIGVDDMFVICNALD